MKIGLREILLAGALSLLIGCEPLDEATDTDDTDTPGSTDTGSGTGTVTLTPVLALGTGSGATFNKGLLALGDTELSGDETMTVSVNLVDTNAANALYTVPTVLAVTSFCTEAGTAKVSANQLVAVNGVAQFTYSVAGCSGTDIIKVSTGGIEALASVNILPELVNSIIFVEEEFIADLVYRDLGTSTNPILTDVVFKLLDKAGRPVAGAAVNFTLVSQTAGNGAGLSRVEAVSDKDGFVSTVVTAGTVKSIVTVEVTHEQIDSADIVVLSSPINISGGKPVLALGTITDGEFENEVLTIGVGDLLSAYGDAEITVDVVNIRERNESYTNPVLVSFSSVCEQAGKATFLDQSKLAIDGSVSTTYKDLGCGTIDVITATIDLADANTFVDVTASLLLEVSAADSAKIAFDDQFADFRTSLAYKNHERSSVPSSTAVRFRVLDAFDKPVSNQLVEFSVYQPSGLSNIDLMYDQRVTDAEGYVTTTLLAGHLATSTRVTAMVTVGGHTISTQSPAIAIHTGLPAAAGFSIHSAPFAVDAFDVRFTSVSVRLADKHNNWVPDGTIVEFTTEHGSIQPTCLTVESQCSVTWRAEGIIPVGLPTTITAYTVGVDSFNEVGKKDGLFSPGDEIIAHSEVYFDLNSTEDYTVDVDGFIDHNGNGVFDVEGGITIDGELVGGDIVGVVYRGVDCSQEALDLDEGHCAETESMIWANIQLTYP